MINEYYHYFDKKLLFMTLLTVTETRIYNIYVKIYIKLHVYKLKLC